jgi:hypothetical protein
MSMPHENAGPASSGSIFHIEKHEGGNLNVVFFFVDPSGK